MTNLWDLTPRQMDARRSLIDTDPPEHVRLRKLGMPAFTGRRVRDYEDTTRLITQELLDEALLVGDVDVVPAISAPLPIRVIVGILGVPAEDADFMVELSDHLVSGGAELAPDAYGNTTPLDLLPFNSPAAFALFDYGRRLGDERRRDPRDDLVTALIQSSIDGDRLSETEYANLFQLLVFAGNETTRTAISNGIKAFMDFPDELEKVHRDPDLIPGAVEEIIRYATPVLHMRRTATRPTVLNDVAIDEGDKVVIWYASANFDDQIFTEPQTFDVARPIKPKMVSFGAQGPHHCLGAPLARLEIRILLEEIVRRGIRFESTGPIIRTPSNFVNGITSLPARLVTRS
jgi:cholest-4-en-3-one 26-monooxygenase